MPKSKGQRKAILQERRITKSLSEIGELARRQIASGSLWFAKSDVVSSMFQIEAKTKSKPSKSFTIKKEWVEKIEAEAFQAGKIPTLVMSFGDTTDYFVLRDRDFLAIVEELLELRKRAGGGC